MELIRSETQRTYIAYERALGNKKCDGILKFSRRVGR